MSIWAIYLSRRIPLSTQRLPPTRPPISVSPLQGKLLHLLARIHGSTRILEIGTLGGYSTIWLARALPPDGRLITLELEARHADIARANLERAGVAGRVEIRLGAALETLPRLAAEKRGPFDLVFIDADKENTPGSFDWALKLTRKGSVIIVDNVVRKGEVANAATADEDVRGIRQFLERAAAEPRVQMTPIEVLSELRALHPWSPREPFAETASRGRQFLSAVITRTKRITYAVSVGSSGCISLHPTGAIPITKKIDSSSGFWSESSYFAPVRRTQRGRLPAELTARFTICQA
jgi:predicted O-methyltransferase YrrM